MAAPPLKIILFAIAFALSSGTVQGQFELKSDMLQWWTHSTFSIGTEQAWLHGVTLGVWSRFNANDYQSPLLSDRRIIYSEDYSFRRFSFEPFLREYINKEKGNRGLFLHFNVLAARVWTSGQIVEVYSVPGNQFTFSSAAMQYGAGFGIGVKRVFRNDRLYIEVLLGAVGFGHSRVKFSDSRVEELIESGYIRTPVPPKEKVLFRPEISIGWVFQNPKETS